MHPERLPENLEQEGVHETRELQEALKGLPWLKRTKNTRKKVHEVPCASAAYNYERPEEFQVQDEGTASMHALSYLCKAGRSKGRESFPCHDGTRSCVRGRVCSTPF